MIPSLHSKKSLDSVFRFNRSYDWGFLLEKDEEEKRSENELRIKENEGGFKLMYSIKVCGKEG